MNLFQANTAHKTLAQQEPVHLLNRTRLWEVNYLIIPKASIKVETAATLDPQGANLKVLTRKRLYGMCHPNPQSHQQEYIL